MEGLVCWLKDIYDEQLNIEIVEGSKNFKNMAKSAVSFPISRMFGFINLKYALAMKTSGYTYVTFTIQKEEKDTFIYSVMYLEKNDPKFVCLSPTFISSKGEFRDGFILYSALEYAFIHYSEELSKIEKKLDNNLFNIVYTVHPPGNKLELDVEMMGKRLLIASIYLILYKKQTYQLQIHSDKLYVDILTSIGNISQHTVQNINLYNYLFKGNMVRPYGQKLIPLSVGEAVKINNIIYPAWRELFISYAASDMVLNGISPTFAIAANWTYIEGVGRDTFDNKIIREKYTQNDEVIEIIEKIEGTLYFFGKGG